MKLSVLLLFIGIFSLSAENVYTQQKELSLDLKNVLISKAIAEIERTSDYVFLITDEAKESSIKNLSTSRQGKYSEYSGNNLERHQPRL